MKVREYRSDDCKEIVLLFYETVHSVNSADYTEIQLNSWAPKDIDYVKWGNRFTNNYPVVVDMDNVIVGFGAVDSTGYFDLLYVHKDYQGIGIGTLIADELEKNVSLKGFEIITTDASITAKPFFEKRGYVVQKKQNVETRGQFLVNYKMQKILRQ